MHASLCSALVLIAEGNGAILLLLESSHTYATISHCIIFPFLAIHEWDDMDSKEFADEKFGLNIAEKQPEKRFYGLIEDPIKQNTPEELERLEEIYSAIDKQYLPASYDSRAYGNKIKIWE